LSNTIEACVNHFRSAGQVSVVLPLRSEDPPPGPGKQMKFVQGLWAIS